MKLQSLTVQWNSIPIIFIDSDILEFQTHRETQHDNICFDLVLKYQLTTICLHRQVETDENSYVFIRKSDPGFFGNSSSHAKLDSDHLDSCRFLGRGELWECWYCPKEEVYLLSTIHDGWTTVTGVYHCLN